MPKRKLTKSCPKSSIASKNRRKSRKKKDKKKPKKDININITLDLNELETSSNMASASQNIESETAESPNALAREASLCPVKSTPQLPADKLGPTSATPKCSKKESNNSRKRKKSIQSLTKSEASSQSKGKKCKNSSKGKTEKILPVKDNSILKFPSMNLFKNIFKKDSNENSSKPLDSSSKATENGQTDKLATKTRRLSNSNEAVSKPLNKTVKNKSSQCASRASVSTCTTTATENVLDAQKCDSANGMSPSNPVVQSASNIPPTNLEKSVGNDPCKQKPQVTSESAHNEINDKNSKCPSISNGKQSFPANISPVNKCSDNKLSFTTIKSIKGPSVTSESNAKGGTSNSTASNTCTTNKTDKETGKNDNSVESNPTKTSVNVSTSNQDLSLQSKPEFNSSKPLENDPNNSAKNQLNSQVPEDVARVNVCTSRPTDTNKDSVKVAHNISCSDGGKPAVAVVAKPSASSSAGQCTSTNSCKNECKNVCETKNTENQCKNHCIIECISDKCTNGSSGGIAKVAGCSGSVNSTNQCLNECPKCNNKCCQGNETRGITGPKEGTSEPGIRSPVAAIDKVNHPIKPCEKVTDSKESSKNNDGTSCGMKNTDGKDCGSEDLKTVDQSVKCTNESDKKDKSIKTPPETKTENIKNRKENQSIFLETDCQSMSEKARGTCQIKKETETNSITTSDLCKCVKANQSVFSEPCQVCSRTKSTNGTNKNSDKGLENKNLFGTPKTKIVKDNESAGQ